MTPMLNDMIRPVLLDAYVHRRAVVLAFVAINLVAIAIAVFMPMKFSSSTTVFVEGRNTLGQLMEGAAVQTGVTDRAQIAREIIYGRKFTDKILRLQGFVQSSTPPVEWEQEVDAIRKRIKITNKGGSNTNLIEIGYENQDPDQAYETTQYIAELFISEANATQLRESESAFQFIDKQVKDYENKLRTSEGQLKKFRAANESVRPGSEADARVRILNLRIKIADLEQEVKEALIRRNAISQQLSGEGKAAGNARLDPNETRRLQLQAQLELLRLSYHDTYPDIVQIKAQIEELDQIIEQNERNRSAARSAALAAGLPYSSGEAGSINPVALKLQQDLYDTRTRIATLTSRLKETRALLEEETERGLLIPEAEARLAELTRDYTVTKNIYEDLLKRREKARVSMSLDREQRGLSLRVDEPAFFPYRPSGPRFWQIALAGIILGIGIPLAAIFGFQQVNPKVRLLPHITDDAEVPVVGVVPHLSDPTELKLHNIGSVILGMLVAGTFLLILSVGILRLQGIL